MNKTIFFILFSLFPISSFCQEKIIEVHVPDGIGSKHGIDDDKITIYRITINNDGYISRVESPNNRDYSTGEVNFEDDRITLKRANNDNESLAVNEILIKEGEILLRGGPRSIYTKNGEDFSSISVYENQDIIFEGEEIKLVKLSEKALETVFKVDMSNFSALTYFDNRSFSDFRFRNNTQWRYEYNGSDNGYTVSYYRMAFYMGEPAAYNIKVYGDNLFTSSNQKNVINYFIISSIYHILADFLFPTIFLEQPFSFDNTTNDVLSEIILSDGSTYIWKTRNGIFDSYEVIYADGSIYKWHWEDYLFRYKNENEIEEQNNDKIFDSRNELNDFSNEQYNNAISNGESETEGKKHINIKIILVIFFIAICGVITYWIYFHRKGMFVAKLKETENKE
jgi:hypothetical protein